MHNSEGQRRNCYAEPPLADTPNATNLQILKHCRANALAYLATASARFEDIARNEIHISFDCTIYTSIRSMPL